LLAHSAHLVIEKSSIGMPRKKETMPVLTSQKQIETSCVTIGANTSPKLEEVRVEMAKMKVESRPVELLTSVGSCVAICLHDAMNRCGGLAHIMLPTSNNPLLEPLPSKFANTAVPALAKAVREISGNDIRLSAKIAGGANMFANLGPNSLDIGGKNVQAVKAALTIQKIRLEGEDVGGVSGRRITFNTHSGIAVVRSFKGASRIL